MRVDIPGGGKAEPRNPFSRGWKGRGAALSLPWVLGLHEGQRGCWFAGQPCTPIGKKPEPAGYADSSHDHFSPCFHKGHPIFRLCNWPVGVGRTREAGWAPSYTAHSSLGHQHGGQATFHLRGGTHAASLCQKHEDSASWGQLEG